jgi:hypothetical protein
VARPRLVGRSQRGHGFFRVPIFVGLWPGAKMSFSPTQSLCPCQCSFFLTNAFSPPGELFVNLRPLSYAEGTSRLLTSSRICRGRSITVKTPNAVSHADNAM